MTKKKATTEKKRALNRIVNVILDTNFFIDMFRFKISFEDIEDVLQAKCNFWIVEQTIKELKNTKAKEAKIALIIIEDIISGKGEYEKKIGILKIGGKAKNTDDAIISLISTLQKRSVLDLSFENLAIATNDIKLRGKIKKLGIKVIYLRARKHLEAS